MANRILIFRIGSLGDTLVSVPAMWAVRNNFPRARITLLCDHHPKNKYVLAADLLAGTRLIDDVIRYPVVRTGPGRFLRPLRMLRLLAKLRSERFDALIYLVPSLRPPAAVERDRRFFTLAGIPQLNAMTGFRDPGWIHPPGQLMPREADLLLDRLEASGLSVGPRNLLRTDLDLRPADHEPVNQWLRSLPPDGVRPWLAVGPGSKMPAKIWPAERYQAVVARLIERYDLWPVIFGGPEDRDIGQRLLDTWGRGYNAAGALPLRPSAAAIGRAVLYLGNDTGTMHLAAAAGVKCAAVFASHAPPGLWYPIGEGHRIFRTPIDCENCGLIECIDRKMECILRIDAEQVYQGCVEILDHLGVAPVSASD